MFTYSEPGDVGLSPVSRRRWQPLSFEYGSTLSETTQVNCVLPRVGRFKFDFNKLPCRFCSTCLHIRNRKTSGYLLLAGSDDNMLCRWPWTWSFQRGFDLPLHTLAKWVVQIRFEQTSQQNSILFRMFTYSKPEDVGLSPVCRRRWQPLSFEYG